MTINVEVNVSPDEMDRAKRLLQENLAEHVNCRSSVVPQVEGGKPVWDAQRVTSFWDAYFIRVTNDG
ncbi:hypothetical protein HVTV1_18 [Haloarcula vallismortis tailed virus 1]|uniref:Uncharacterized protein n=1 Tax=Haloarcula vallismortis tailed virus 1 TaxID=1262528 RepID=L7TJ21_9CAUD|nr:hypothetical protein HVTV1_18 [Haloarcula vallismortis tailed virus 1]AGC34388.1 hypothetical protein HVTV1_18 [Haloarcula vallismortis tailed virus 1]